jgi:hypothetical protein
MSTFVKMVEEREREMATSALLENLVGVEN